MTQAEVRRQRRLAEREAGKDFYKMVEEKSEVDFKDEDDKSKRWLHKEPHWGLKVRKL